MVRETPLHHHQPAHASVGKPGDVIVATHIQSSEEHILSVQYSTVNYEHNVEQQASRTFELARLY